MSDVSAVGAVIAVGSVSAVLVSVISLVASLFGGEHRSVLTENLGVEHDSGVYSGRKGV